MIAFNVQVNYLDINLSKHLNFRETVEHQSRIVLYLILTFNNVLVLNHNIC